MSEIITRRKAILGAGGALAAAAAGCAHNCPRPLAAARPASLQEGQNADPNPEYIGFEQIWPADLEQRPGAGYNRAALLIFTLAGQWNGDNNDREAAKRFIHEAVDGLKQIDLAATPRSLPPAETAAGKVFRELWMGKHRNNPNRDIGFRATALNFARFGYVPPSAKSWHLLREPAAEQPAEPQEQPPMMMVSEHFVSETVAVQDKDNPSYEQNGVTQPEKEEVHELVDELP